jgi:hypothetical protein
VLDTVSLELVSVGRAEDLVASDLGGHDLADDVLVGEADDQAVLGSIVLVLGLGDEALTGVVIGLALLAALVLSLVATAKLLAFSPRRPENSRAGYQLTCSTRSSSQL